MRGPVAGRGGEFVYGGGHGGPPGGGGGGGPDEMRGSVAGHGGGRGGGHGGRHGGGLGRMPEPGAGPDGPGAQRGHSPGAREPSIDGEELRPPEAGDGDADQHHAPTAISDNESASSHDDDEEANPIQANGEFDPRHQFHVPPADNNPDGPAAGRVPHDRRQRGNPEGWIPNAGGGAATTGRRGGQHASGLLFMRDPKAERRREKKRRWEAQHGRVVRLPPPQPIGGEKKKKKKHKDESLLVAFARAMLV